MKRTMMGGWAESAPTALRYLVVGVVVSPWSAWASTEAIGAASTGPNLSGVGRVLGMMLLAYLALKWFNRKKVKDEDEPRGFLGLSVKPWVVWLVVIGGLGLLMVQSG